jgi:hypothetical protein
MRFIALLSGLLFLQDPAHELTYRGQKGDKNSVTGDVVLKLKIDGTDALTNLVRSSMEFLSFSKIHIKGEGVRRVTRTAPKGTGIKIEYATARVEGVYDDEPFEYDFERKAPPEKLAEDKLKQICWFLSMGGPDYRIGTKGEFASNDPNKDAWGEAMEIAVNALVRLPEKPVAAGGEWSAAWKGAYKQKDNDGRFAFSQKAKLEKVEGKRARIAFEATGTLEIPEARREKNAEVQETKYDAKGFIVLDLESGGVVTSESTGSVRARYKGTDPNTGEAHELKVDFEVESKFTTKD